MRAELSLEQWFLTQADGEAILANLNIPLPGLLTHQLTDHLGAQGLELGFLQSSPGGPNMERRLKPLTCRQNLHRVFQCYVDQEAKTNFAAIKGELKILGFFIVHPSVNQTVVRTGWVF